MSGIEVAGVVLACLPLILPALDVYKDGLKGFKRFFHPVKDVEGLIHKLLLHQIELGSLMKMTLVRANVDAAQIPDEDEDLAQLLMQDRGLQDAVKSYFGATNFALYEVAVKGCAAVIDRLARCLSEFLPDDINGDLVRFVLQSQGRPRGKISVSQRIKIVLKKSDVDQCLQQLETSINGLRRLTKSIAATQDICSNSGNAKASRVAKKLSSIRSQAGLLYSALCRFWCCDKHRHHRANFFLDGASTVSDQRLRTLPRTKTSDLSRFRLALNHISGPGRLVWHECEVRIVIDEDEQTNPIGPLVRGVSPRVVIHCDKTVENRYLKAPEVKNLCLVVEQAISEQKLTNLYLLTQNNKMRYEQVYTQQCQQSSKRTITLQEVFSLDSGPRAKIGYRERMFLAFNLAASLLQLQGTPWMNRSWQASQICFMESTDSSPGSQKRQGIDYYRPMIPHSFEALQPSSTSIILEPREALLELGIMLLELWHETSIESFKARPLPDDYFNRLSLAVEWLDDIHNEPLPKYADAIERCLGAFRVKQSEWNDFAFQKELYTDILEPLQACFEPFQKTWNPSY